VPVLRSSGPPTRRARCHGQYRAFRQPGASQSLRRLRRFKFQSRTRSTRRGRSEKPIIAGTRSGPQRKLQFRELEIQVLCVSVPTRPAVSQSPDPSHATPVNMPAMKAWLVCTEQRASCPDVTFSVRFALVAAYVDETEGIALHWFLDC
jgi:hypothetical protein